MSNQKACMIHAWACNTHLSTVQRGEHLSPNHGIRMLEKSKTLDFRIMYMGSVTMQSGTVWSWVKLQCGLKWVEPTVEIQPPQLMNTRPKILKFPPNPLDSKTLFLPHSSVRHCSSTHLKFSSRFQRHGNLKFSWLRSAEAAQIIFMAWPGKFSSSSKWPGG